MVKKAFAHLLRNTPARVFEIGNRFAFLLQNAWVIFRQFRAALETKKFIDRRDLWRYAVTEIGVNSRILFLEFGVWQGESIKEFSRLMKAPDSELVGIDSFEGLPEDWDGNFIHMKAGTFSMNGVEPILEDRRVRFIKGWFNETLPSYLSNRKVDAQSVLVHLDADLFTSTLYVLTTLGNTFDRFYFIFDQWMGGEALALSTFARSFGYEITFRATAATGQIGLPAQVFGLAARTQ